MGKMVKAVQRKAQFRAHSASVQEPGTGLNSLTRPGARFSGRTARVRPTEYLAFETLRRLQQIRLAGVAPQL